MARRRRKRHLKGDNSTEQAAGTSTASDVKKRNATNAARDAVFKTAELLELILEQLPLQEILRARRVDTDFNSIIKTSTKFEQQLFLRPKVPRETWLLNPTLTRGYRPVFQAAAENQAGQRFLVAKENPFAFEPAEFSGGRDCKGPALWLHPSAIKRLGRFLKRSYIGCESWLSMLLTNPPCTKAMVDLRFFFRDHARLSLRCTVEDKAGVTFETLLREVFDTRSPDTECLFHERPGGPSDLLAPPKQMTLENKCLRNWLQELSAKHSAVELGPLARILAHGVVCLDDKLHEEAMRGADDPV